jgi:hypothetical protein
MIANLLYDARMRLAAVLVMIAACNPFREGAVTGRLESNGEAGTWVLEQGTCYSGQREQYHGVIGIGPDGTGIAVKLVKDGVRGWSAVINHAESCKTSAEKQKCNAIVLTATNCTTLDVDLENTNTTINDIRVVEAKLRMDCSSAAGSIKGTLAFERCH